MPKGGRYFVDPRVGADSHPLPSPCKGDEEVLTGGLTC